VYSIAVCESVMCWLEVFWDVVSKDGMVREGFLYIFLLLSFRPLFQTGLVPMPLRSNTH
jgi:hypothetical protein